MSMRREGNMLTWHTVDLAEMSFAEQLHAMRKTNVLVGVHGAGLMLVVFTAEESILLEIHPNYRQPSSPSLTPPLSEKPSSPPLTPPLISSPSHQKRQHQEAEVVEATTSKQTVTMTQTCASIPEAERAIRGATCLSLVCSDKSRESR